MDENILCFERKHLSKFLIEKGYIQDVSALKNIPYEFTARAPAETNEALKQIIPYCFITRECGNDVSYFIYRRTKGSNEKRLADLYSIGVGGHLEQKDVSNGDMLEIIRQGLNRELDEELLFTQSGQRGDFVLRGGIYDDSNAVGRVHFGVLIHFRLDSGVDCSIREVEALDKGQWVSKEWLENNLDKFESWSKILIENVLC